MASDLMFPGIVMILKLVFKLAVEQEVKIVDALKALMAFPVDIAFLSFLFGAAILYKDAAVKLSAEKAQPAFVFLVGCLLLAFLITMACKKADRYFVTSKPIRAFIWGFIGYIFSMANLYISLNTGALL